MDEAALKRELSEIRKGITKIELGLAAHYATDAEQRKTVDRLDRTIFGENGNISLVEQVRDNTKARKNTSKLMWLLIVQLLGIGSGVVIILFQGYAR